MIFGFPVNYLYILITMENEIWKNIENYEGLYQVSNLGKVKSLDRIINDIKGKTYLLKGKEIKFSQNNSGYVLVVLSKNKKSKTYLVHRLVAETFIPNPNNLPQVNHKNEIKSDNRVENLEWCSAKYNINYGTCIERAKLHYPSRKGKNNPNFSKKMSKELYEKLLKINSKPICQYSKQGEFIKKFNSISEAAKELNMKSSSSIQNCLYGKAKTAYGYKWQYAV